jgi:hypothetical protein
MHSFELTIFRTVKNEYVNTTAYYKMCSIDTVQRKKGFSIFPSPAGLSLTKLSLGWNNLSIPAQGELG